LNLVPAAARILRLLPHCGIRRDKAVVTESFRDWTLDVLNVVLGSATVPVAVCNVPLRTSSTPSVRRDADRRARDARAPHFARELEQLHPDNRHVRDKIRQQLQVLRDLGLLQHPGPGLWRLP
jgi:hypothetical protein